MTANSLDLSTLGLIRNEVERALDDTDGALAQALGETADSSCVAKARRLLAGVPEALELAGIAGVARVIVAVDALLADLQLRDIRTAGESINLCRRACAGVRTLLADTPALPNPLALAPIYGQLLRARGDDRVAELDLFFPDLSRELSDSPAQPPLERTVDMRASLAAQRVRYQEALLRWLRNGDAQALQDMHAAVDGAAQVAPTSRLRSFWHVAGALMQLMSAGVVPAHAHVKRLCSALDQDMRRSGDRGEPSETSLRTMLYCIWSAPSDADSESVAAVRRAYGLDAIQRGADDGVRKHLAAAAQVRTALEPLRTLWEAAGEGQRGALPDFQWQVGALRAACAPCGGLDELLDFLAEAAKRDPAHSADRGVEVATVLLVLESLCAQGMQPWPGLQASAGEWAARLRAAASGSGNLADDAVREAAFREQLTNELLAGLMRVQERLTAFFEDASRRGELDAALKALTEVRGALTVLGEPEAGRALAVASDAVQTLAACEGPASDEDVRRVAGVVSAVLHFVEQMRYGGADVRALLRQVGMDEDVVAAAQRAPQAGAGDSRSEPQPEHGQLQVAPTPTPPAPQDQGTHPVDRAGDADMLMIFLEEAKEVLGAIDEAVARLREQPTNGEALAIARRGVHTLKGSGRMVGLTHLGEAAWAVERALNRVLEQKQPVTEELVGFIDAGRQRFAAWVRQLEDHGQAVVDGEAITAWAEAVRKGEPLPASPSPGASQSVVLESTVQIGDARLSPALYRVYVSEAEQRLGHMLARFDELRADEAAACVGEAFVHAAHTLAGISGTTGVKAVYELGEQLELVLLHLHRVPAPIDIQDRELIGRTLSTLSAMVESVRRRKAPELAPELVAALQALHRRFDAAAHAAPAAALAQQVEPAPSGAEADVEPDVRRKPSMDDRRQNRLQDDPDEALLPVFLQEAADLVPQVGHWLREWRGQRANPQLPSALQRLLHTLKGSARMAGAMAIGELTHSMESRVASAAHTLVVPDVLLDGLESSLDRLGLLLDRLPHRARQPSQGQPDSGTAAQPQQAMIRVRAALVDRLVNESGELAVTRARAQNDLKGMRLSLTDLTDSIIRLRAQVREIEIQAESQIQSRIAVAREAGESAFDPLEFDRYTRLQELTRFLAESVNDLATVQHGMLEQLDSCNAGLTAQTQITRLLQDELMGMRLTPVGSLTERLYRVARLTARETGKAVRLDIVGGQVEMDRSVVERIAGALEHLVRNAIVHGIEEGASRSAAGKQATGQVTLEVRQEGNEVLFALSDDGAGLDLDRIGRKAVELGLIGADAVLPEAELGNLIFAAGVSTAREVTQAAGRGVGLDAVRSEVNALGGRVAVKFERGRGTRFMIHVPVTLSVLHALVVRSAQRPYALPAQMVDQVRTLKPAALEEIYAAGVVSFQGCDYAVRHLQHLLGEPEYAPLRQRFNPLVLVRSGADCIALHVDELAGNQEIVIKNIGEQVARVTGITGAAVLPSGETLLILNPVLLAQGGGAGRNAPGWSQPLAAAAAPIRPVVMVVDDSITVRKITGKLLARAGYEAVEARDGVEALERLAELKPDVVLSDIEMPRMDGFELIRQLRGDSRWRRIPVLVISSRTADKHRNLALELGADVFLGKPYQDEQLLSHIARLIGAPAVLSALQEPGV